MPLIPPPPHPITIPPFTKMCTILFVSRRRILLDSCNIDLVLAAPPKAPNNDHDVKDEPHPDHVNHGPLPDVCLKSKNPFRRQSSRVSQPDAGPSISFPAARSTTTSPCHATTKQEWEKFLDEMMEVETHKLQDECMIRCSTCGLPSAHGQGKLDAPGSHCCPVQLQLPQPFVQLFHPFILDTSQLPIGSCSSPPLYTASPNPCSSCGTFHPRSTYLARSCALTVIHYPDISSSSCQCPFHSAYRMAPSYEGCHCSIHCRAYAPHLPVPRTGAAQRTSHSPSLDASLSTCHAHNSRYQYLNPQDMQHPVRFRDITFGSLFRHTAGDVRAREVQTKAGPTRNTSAGVVVYEG